MLAVEVNWDLFSQYGKVLSPTTMVVGTFLAGVSIWLVFYLRARFREDTGRTDNELEMLTQFRELRQQGELTEEEYRLIKSRLAHEAGARMSVTPVNARQSADTARAGVQQDCSTEKTGETGRDGSDCEKSSTTDESPNQNSAK